MLFILLCIRYEFGALLVGVFMALAKLNRVGPRHSQAQFNIRAGGRANAFQVLAPHLVNWARQSRAGPSFSNTLL